MKLYEYTAIDRKGRKIKASIEGNKDEILNFIKSNDFLLLDLREIKPGKRKNFSEDEFLNDLESIKFLLEAGLTIEDAIKNLIISKKQDSSTKVIWFETLNKIKSGETFSKALKKTIENQKLNILLPYLPILELTEETANLNMGIVQVIKILRFKMETRRKILETLTYPLFLLTISILILVFILLFVIPQFTQVFEQNKLPLLTQLIFRLSQILRDNLNAIILFVIVTLIIMWRSRNFLIPLLSKTPVIRNVYRYWILSQLFQFLALTMQANLDIAKAIRILSNIATDSNIRNILSIIEKELKKGNSLSQALNYTDICPSDTVTILATAEKANTLETAMDKLAKKYENLFFTDIKKLLSILEPAVMIIIGILIGAIVIAIMLAIVSTSDFIG